MGVQRLVDCAEAAVGFMVSPVPTAEVMKVADAGQLLPAKVIYSPLHALCLVGCILMRCFLMELTVLGDVF